MSEKEDLLAGNIAYGAFISKVMSELGDRQIESSFTAHLQDSIDKLTDLGNSLAPMKVSLNDSYTNSLLAIGSGENGDQVEKFTSFGLDNSTLNWMLWTALYTDSWVFRVAIDKPAQDEVNCGLTIKNDDSGKIQKLITKNKQKLIDLLRWGALYGGSIAVCMFKGLKDEDYAKPIQADKIKNKVPHLYVTDRWYGCGVSSEVVDDMDSLDFGKPEFYNVTLADGTEVKVHHSYILRYEHRNAPMFVKQGLLQNWGMAEGCHIFNELSRDEKLKSSIQSLVDKSLIEVIKMSGMRGVFMGSKSTENRKLLEDRLEMVSWARSFNSLTLLDKDDDYQEHGFSGLGGLSDILEKNMWLIAAALEMQGVLYGNLSNGFSNDADALKRYDETIRNRCDAYYRPVLEKYIGICCLTLGISEAPEFEFDSLYKNETDKDKMEGLDKFIDVLSKLLSDGVIDGKKYASILNTYSTKGKVDISFTEEELNKVDTSMQEMSEAIDEIDIPSTTKPGGHRK